VVERNVENIGIDKGKKRRVEGALRQAGETNTRNLAAAIRFVLNYRNGFVPGGTASQEMVPSDEEIKIFLETNPDIRISANLISGLNKSRFPSDPSIIAGLHFLFSRLDPGLADTWVRSMGGQIPPPYESWRRTRELLLENRASNKRYVKTHVIALLIKCWNAAREGRNPKVIKWAQAQEEFPCIR